MLGRPRRPAVLGRPRRPRVDATRPDAEEIETTTATTTRTGAAGTLGTDARSGFVLRSVVVTGAEHPGVPRCFIARSHGRQPHRFDAAPERFVRVEYRFEQRAIDRVRFEELFQVLHGSVAAHRVRENERVDARWRDGPAFHALDAPQIQPRIHQPIDLARESRQGLDASLSRLTFRAGRGVVNVEIRGRHAEVPVHIDPIR